MKVTACGSGQPTALKRLQNLSDFALPIYWDNMTESDHLKVIDLDRSSMEYKTVSKDFNKTVTKTVLKVQRIQNINLRRLYKGRKRELENRNGPVGAAERILYHGTSEESCSSIMQSNFNRNFAGQNATLYSHGRVPPGHEDAPVSVAPDLYDSVVDNMQNPTMFVVFHDCQAYPDYLITFK
ncbi:protein mono-ADP-ribosyltransferase PARP15 [Puntigrus tetrazona]|uniref:protein mono-ADP-ribosyltransferase PARP15 n=1 Tax=Puntigrus tetrazona TaxID=1606681 RepID=UPI001C8A5024|nr:protein mono-ADP-ribosyltransferase PARP15 [Puntigrus tetrazona]